MEDLWDDGSYLPYLDCNGSYTNLYKWLNFTELQNVVQNVKTGGIQVRSVSSQLCQYQLPGFHTVQCYH